jgi:hypothetical protein
MPSEGHANDHFFMLAVTIKPTFVFNYPSCRGVHSCQVMKCKYELDCGAELPKCPNRCRVISWMHHLPCIAASSSDAAVRHLPYFRVPLALEHQYSLQMALEHQYSLQMSTIIRICVDMLLACETTSTPSCKREQNQKQNNDNSELPFRVSQSLVRCASNA